MFARVDEGNIRHKDGRIKSVVNVESRRGITGEGQREGGDTQILEELRCQTVTFSSVPYSEL